MPLFDRVELADLQVFLTRAAAKLGVSQSALSQTVAIPRIDLKEPKAKLERLADGRANWTFTFDAADHIADDAAHGTFRRAGHAAGDAVYSTGR